MEAGGGVHGRADGIALVITTRRGCITGVYLLFTDMFLPVGETITEIANGKVIDGNIMECRTGTFKETGGHGNATGTGRNVIGAFRNFLKKGIPLKSEWRERLIEMIDRNQAPDQVMVLYPVPARFINIS